MRFSAPHPFVGAAARGRRTYSAVAAVGAAALFTDVLIDVFTGVFTDVFTGVFTGVFTDVFPGVVMHEYTNTNTNAH